MIKWIKVRQTKAKSFVSADSNWLMAKEHNKDVWKLYVGDGDDWKCVSKEFSLEDLREFAEDFKDGYLRERSNKICKKM